MRVKVGDRTYDSEEESVMVILSEKDKQNIRDMLSDATKYCSFPESADTGQIARWMGDDE